MEQSLSEILLNALIDGGIKRLVRAANEYLRYPVMVTDVNYNLIAHSPEEALSDPLWDAIYQFGTTPPDFVNKLYIDNMMPLG